MSRDLRINELVRVGLISQATATALQTDPSASLIASTSEGAAVADVAGTAGGTYTSTEQDTINENKSQINALLAELRTLGIIAT